MVKKAWYNLPKLVTIAAMFTGIVLLLLWVWNNVGVTYITVQNNTQYGVQVWDCSQDPYDIQAGKSLKFYTHRNDSHNTCRVYGGQNGGYVGCLLVPTDTDVRYFKVNNIKKNMTEDQCMKY